MPYAFGELGWVQFERLSIALLQLERGVPRERWVGRADEVATAAADDGTTFAILWARGDRLLPGVRDADVVVTNVAGPSRCGRKETIGPAEVAAIVDRRPELRLRVPSVLGVLDLGGLEPGSFDLTAARELARVFVPTHAYLRTLDVLGRHGFAVLTGPPEMGKTAIARTIGLALLTDGWEVHECIRPEQLWAAFDRGERQLFVADDAFGSTEYRPEGADRWALDLDRVLRAMDARHRLIWTSRPAPLKAGLRRIHREHGVERWPQPVEVEIEAADLDVEEKASILFRHARSRGLTPTARRAVQRNGWRIVSHRHFTPERIRRLVAGGLPDDARAIYELVERGIREPTAAMAASLRALDPAHRALLVALLDAPPAPVSERDLASSARRHFDGGLPQAPSALVDRLTDHFLRLVPPTSVTWVHPSWRDLVVEELAADADARRRFLAACGLDGVLLSLSTAGGATGERRLPLLVDDADWDICADRVVRLLPALGDEDVLRLLASLEEVAEHDAEARALARDVLEQLVRLWRQSPLTVLRLGGWWALAARLPDPPEAPDPGALWVELAPGDPPDPVRAGDWIALVELLERYDPRQLPRLGYRATVREAVVSSRTGGGEASGPLEPRRASAPDAEQRSLVRRVLSDLE